MLNRCSKLRTVKTGWLFSFFAIAIFISGCSSIVQGVVGAIIDKPEDKDTRQCRGWGETFTGIDADLVKKQGKTKVLFVHGVGDHIPGYTTEFLEKLSEKLDLNERSKIQKNIELNSPLLPGKDLGNLRVTHLLNEQNGHELTFYELTWSEITRQQKAMLDFDTSGEYDFRRAKINSILKKFGNDTGPDPFIYLEQSRYTEEGKKPILAAFSQSACWMVTQNWEELPKDGKHECMGLNDASADHIANDSYVFISHSLGSLITIDGMQHIASMLGSPEKYLPANKKTTFSPKAIQALQNKRIPFFMLSNQLPMLQFGREPPKIVGKEASYCDPKGADYKKRMVSETDIIAFSDPNDLLSYAIPPGFSEKYIDSRLCAKITNIDINIAKVMNALGVADLANPIEAHLGYVEDDRVISMIAKGIVVNQPCKFTKEVD